MTNDAIIIRSLGKQDYMAVWQSMQQFTNQRLIESENATPDEIWLLEHHPVFTQGQNGKPEHILDPGDIPIVQTDRGGQVTYHGPGQLMVYVLIDLKRKKWNVRQFVTLLEQSVIDMLASLKIQSAAKCDAPGVYVDGKKLCSIGLRIRRGCSYHGIAFNVNMDLSPFMRINPCGFSALKMTQLADLSAINHVSEASRQLANFLIKNLGYTSGKFVGPDLENFSEKSNGK